VAAAQVGGELLHGNLTRPVGWVKRRGEVLDGVVFRHVQRVLVRRFDLVNAPYDAKAIGDYTGLTPPFGFGH
jgi:hypothetical protein